MTRALPLVLTLLLALPAAAQVESLTWEDPALADAVKDADLIVLAEAEAVGQHGAAYRVKKTLKGPRRDGAKLAITGLHHPKRRVRPPVEVKDLAYLLLIGKPKGEGFTLPTPTLGRFPLKDREGKAKVVVASLGGVETFVRMTLPPARFEALLLGLVKGKAPALLAAARTTLAQRDADSEQVYWALRHLALFGGASERDQVPHLFRILSHPRHRPRAMFQVRAAAARALGHLGGSLAVRRLLYLAERDRHPAVRSLATVSLIGALPGGAADPLKSRVTPRLLALAEKASWRPVTFAHVEDPRANRLDSPLGAALRTLAALGEQKGAKPAKAALKRGDAGSIEAGLAFFTELKDIEQAGAVIALMRGDGAQVDQLFGEGLEKLTKQKLGGDKQAWLKWWLGRGGGR